jgi:GlcNAc-P-P-Und epimerase
MSYFLIGASGFVGSKLISVLGVKNCKNLDKNQSPFYPEITNIGDIRFKNEIVLDKKSSTVILLAAEHRDDVNPKSLYYDVNVKGVKNVLDCMDEYNIKNIIFTSSVAVYGLNKINPDETHLLDPFNHYGKSKLMGEMVIKEWYNKDPQNKSAIIIRPTVIFGERNRGNVYNLLKQISSKKFLMIGKGVNKKSMAYVGNVAHFIKFHTERDSIGYDTYNYVDTPDMSMNDLLDRIQHKLQINIPNFKIPYSLGLIAGYFFDFLNFLLNKKLPISSVRVKKFCATTQFNAKKAHSIFNAPFTLKQGLNFTLEHEFINPKDDDVLFYSE